MLANDAGIVPDRSLPLRYSSLQHHNERKTAHGALTIRSAGITHNTCFRN